MGKLTNGEASCDGGGASAWHWGMTRCRNTDRTRATGRAFDLREGQGQRKNGVLGRAT